MTSTILKALQQRAHLLATKHVTLGFDGFVDILYRVIRSKDVETGVTFFRNVPEFGQYIVEKGERNFSVEIEEITTKLGGNMPIMANALAELGTFQHCIGALGYPSIHPIFSALPSNCELLSFSNPGITNAFEFNGSKIMFASMGPLNRISWDTIKTNIGVEKITKLFSQSDLLCFLNWSEIDSSSSLWKGILSDILPHLRKDKTSIAFFDLSDCSKRNTESISEALTLLKSFSSYFDVVLSLNLNEAGIVFNTITGKLVTDHEIEQVGEAIHKSLEISEVLIHYSKEALAWSNTGFARVSSLPVSSPVLSTGAGDNFNAGYCAAKLMELDSESALTLAHATSHFYMSNGRSPAMKDLADLLRERLTT